MELRQLQAFVRVVEAGTFTRAADDLSLTQPAITRQIGALERELKTRLLDRLGRKVALTAEGHALYDYAAQIVHMAEEAQRAVADVAAGVCGQLSVGASGTAAAYILPSIWSAFCRAHPGVELNMRTGPSAHVVEMVLAGLVDLGVVMNFKGRSGIARVDVASYDSVLVVSPQSPLARFSAGAPLAALAEQPLIVMQAGANLRGYVDELLAQVGVTLHIAMELDNVEAIKKMIEARLGVSILPRLAMEAEVADGRLKALPLLDVPNPQRPISAIYREDKYLSAALKAFVQILKGALAPPPSAKP